MTSEKLGVYDNQYSPTNLYGKALGLLTEFVVRGSKNGVHVDLGCGYGRIAEPLIEALGCRYLGLDFDQAALKNLTSRGHETLRVDLNHPKRLRALLEAKLKHRKIISVSFLDCLEHITTGQEVLREISELAAKHNAPVVVSTPNFLHKDIVGKLVFGKWQYTSSGLLDHTHVRLFSEEQFLNTLSSSGLRVAKRDDVLALKSDQHFPAYHPAISDWSAFGGLLNQIAKTSNTNRTVNQFLALCLPAPPRPQTFYIQNREPDRPFLSIVMRTQGQRKQPLNEALLCLFAQELQNFEVVLVGHNLTIERQISVEEVLQDLPTEFKEKIDFIRVEGHGRAYPLNRGFSHARGHYICALDDDDLVFAQYTKVFQEVALSAPGRIARAVCVLQEARKTEVLSSEGTAAFGELRKVYPSSYDFFQHLSDNQTPNMSAAYPRAVFHDLGLRFDESLTTAEDWDFFCRSATIVGVAGSEEITSIYRWWQNLPNSLTIEAKGDWSRNREAIMRKLDEQFIILPGSVLPRIRGLLDMEARVASSMNISAGDTAKMESLSTAVRWATNFDRLQKGVRDGLREKKRGISMQLKRMSENLRRKT